MLNRGQTGAEIPGDANFRQSHLINTPTKASKDQYLTQRAGEEEGPSADGVHGVQSSEAKSPKKKLLIEQIAMPLIRSGVSLQSDMKLGWRPQMDVAGAPIPLYYDYEPFVIPINPATCKECEALYMGPRYKHSLAMHKAFANKFDSVHNRMSYTFKEPPNMSLINQIIKQTHQPEMPRIFVGMNPTLLEGDQLSKELVFDSNFESGNLDMVIKKKDFEYDLYMRVDTNTKGHHQWFYFSVEHNSHFMGKKVKFNIVNFTKGHSLYTQGMRVCISRKSYNYIWTKGGEEITYKASHISKQSKNQEAPQKFYQMLSFVYEFQFPEDKTFFSYCFPYDFSKLVDFISTQKQTVRNLGGDFLKENVLCQSLGGVDVPLLTISSRLTSDPENYQTIKMQEFNDSYSRISLPFYKKKKNIIICARVHPGESNSSYMMQGFLKYLCGNSLQARELRKRCVFKIIPMVNPDGVIIGNYRTNMAGNDLNRKYHAPDEKLHPTVCAIKKLVSQIVYPEGKSEDAQQPPEEERVFAFIDMHGHSRKKNVFIYGPYYPLHHDRYLKMRIIPKLLSEETSKFRFFSCKFRIERSKEKAARIVLWREFNIMNCFTFEASFHGALNDERQTEEFTPDSLEKMGESLVNSLYEYFLILEEEDRQKKLKELSKKKKTAKKPQSSTALESGATDSVSGGPKRKKSIVQGNASTSISMNSGSFLQVSKKPTNGIELVNIEEEHDEEDSSPSHLLRENQVSNSMGGNIKNNPNEPPEDSKQQEARDIRNIHGSRIRSLKQMFSILKLDEVKRQQGEISEEDDDDSDDEKKGAGGGGENEDSGSDSDPLEGELTGKEQAALYSNIIGSINQFEDYYNGGGNGGSSKKRNNLIGSSGLKLKKKKGTGQEQQRNTKLPPQNVVSGADMSKTNEGTKTLTKKNEQPVTQAPMIVQTKQQKKTFKQIGEDNQRISHNNKDPYQLQQKPKIQAIVAHTNIEFFSKDVTKGPGQMVIGTQYNTLKSTGYGITSMSYNQKDPRAQQQHQKMPFNNPLLINKLNQDAEQAGIQNVIPHGGGNSSTRPIATQQPQKYMLNRTNFGPDETPAYPQNANHIPHNNNSFFTIFPITDQAQLFGTIKYQPPSQYQSNTSNSSSTYQLRIGSSQKRSEREFNPALPEQKGSASNTNRTRQAKNATPLIHNFFGASNNLEGLSSGVSQGKNNLRGTIGTTNHHQSQFGCSYTNTSIQSHGGQLHQRGVSNNLDQSSFLNSAYQSVTLNQSNISEENYNIKSKSQRRTVGAGGAGGGGGSKYPIEVSTVGLLLNQQQIHQSLLSGNQTQDAQNNVLTTSLVSSTRAKNNPGTTFNVQKEPGSSQVQLAQITGRVTEKQDDFEPRVMKAHDSRLKNNLSEISKGGKSSSSANKSDILREAGSQVKKSAGSNNLQMSQKDDTSPLHSQSLKAPSLYQMEHKQQLGQATNQQQQQVVNLSQSGQSPVLKQGSFNISNAGLPIALQNVTANVALGPSQNASSLSNHTVLAGSAFGNFPSTRSINAFKNQYQQQQLQLLMQAQYSQSAKKSQVGSGSPKFQGQGHLITGSAFGMQQESLSNFVGKKRQPDPQSSNSNTIEAQATKLGVFQNGLPNIGAAATMIHQDLNSKKDRLKEKSRMLINGGQQLGVGIQGGANSIGAERQQTLSHYTHQKTDHQTSSSKQNAVPKNFEEIKLPDHGAGAAKKRTSRANQSFQSNSKGVESQTQQAVMMSKFSGAVENYPDLTKSESKRHAKFQHIIDTLLADQYPITVPLAHQNEINASLRNML